MNICTVCQTIPFDQLPSEEQLALPHHDSLQSLITSAAEEGGNCSLCLLIALAVGDLCATLKHERDGNRDALPENAICFMRGVTLPSGKSPMLKAEMGKYNAPGHGISCTGDGPAYRGPMYFSPLEMFPAERYPGLRPWIFGNWWRTEGPGGPPQLIGLGVRLSTTANIEDAVGNTDKCVALRGSLIRIRTKENSLLADMVPGRLRTASTNSPAIFERCLSWLKGCDVYHKCAPSNSSPPPTRVLDIQVPGNSGLVKLINKRQMCAVQPVRPPYVALSHCWGTSHRIVTKQENLAAHMQGISLSDLPATFQHSVEITRRLGIRYLWIDSLCIIQDDAQDWEREAAKMADVYANAHVAIAVDSSTDDSSGCYTTFDERKDIPFVSTDNRALGRRSHANAALWDDAGRLLGMRTNAIVNLANKGSLYMSREWMPSSLNGTPPQDHPLVYMIGKFGKSFDPIARENLSKRGWTLQERLLAPRTLHFTKAQVYWECQEVLLPEDGAVCPRMFPSWKGILSFSTPNEPQPNGGSVLLALPYPFWIVNRPGIPYNYVDGWSGDIWLNLVERFSARKLTCEKDKLPALSGVARRFASLSNDVYHAGIWRRNLLSGLHWQVLVLEPQYTIPLDAQRLARVSPPSRDMARKPAADRAPSWSWASIDGEVTFLPLNAEKSVATVEVCHTPVAGEDEFGQLEPGGYIKLLAPVVQVIRGVPPSSAGGANHFGHFPFRVPVEIADRRYTNGRGGGAYFDAEEHLPCMALFLDDQHALLLKKRVDGNYERMGVCTLRDFDSSQIAPSEVTLV